MDATAYSCCSGCIAGRCISAPPADALKTSESARSVSLWTLVGILCFYIIEQFLHWRHNHSIEMPAAGAGKPATFAKMNLLGDGIHNFVDGILIAGSFLVDPMLGVATTFAIVMHEIPQEISDIAVLIHGGHEKKQAVKANLKMDS